VSFIRKIRQIRGALLAAAIATTLVAGAPSTAQAIPADILWVIDVSSSMGGDINEIRTRIGDFNLAMINAGIEPSYGLVEFGGNVSGTDDWALVTDITADLATFTTGLNSISANHGNPESGSSAGLFALGNATWTAGSVKNIILVTDEDDDSDGFNVTTGACGTRANCNAFDIALGAENALFNVIRNPGAGNTTLTYDFLAGQHGGTAFDILAFRNDPNAFFDNFVDTKVQEIIDNPGNPIPEPASMILFSAGLLLVGRAIRSKKQD